MIQINSFILPIQHEYIFFLTAELITYRDNCKTQTADNKSIRYEHHHRNI